MAIIEYMNITFYIIGILVISIVLSIPMLRKPLSEDEGSWYYPAVFLKKGVRLYKNFGKLYGYFGIFLIAAKIYNLFNFENIRFFQYFKAVWYSLTALTIYWLTYCFWHDSFISFTAAFTFLVITVIPNTLFVLTYGEHFFILPINLSIIFSYYGISTDNNLYFLLAGLMSGWAVQIKPTALLFSVFSGVTCLLSSNYFITTVNYVVGFLVLNLIPLLILRKYGAKSMLSYVARTFGSTVVIVNIVLDRLKLPFGVRLTDNICKYLGARKAYFEKHHSVSVKSQGLSFKRFMLPAVKDLYLILILAAGQVLYLFISFDIFVLSMIMLFFTFLLMQQFQKNYYTPHFNPCWAPISILAAKTICDMWPFLLNSGVLGWILMGFFVVESIKMGNIIAKTFSKGERNTFGYLGPMIGMLFRLPESIGQYIQQNSKENDKLFVWGDQPSIYLYSKREVFNTDYLIIYSHQKRILLEEKLLESLREKPPELLIFYNIKANDGWNINKLQESIGIPYKFLRSFKITDNQGRTIMKQNGIVYDFPLYRRDDTKYKEVLLDRSLLAKRNGDSDKARKYLEDIREIISEDFEASIRLSIMRNNADDVISARSCLVKKLEENHNVVDNAILLRLLAEIDVTMGNADSALRNFEKAFDLNPNDFRIHSGLGGLYYAMGKAEDATKSFQKAFRLFPYSSDILNNIGVLLLRAGKQEDAIKCFQKALAFQPSHSLAHKNLKALSPTQELPQ